MPLDKELLKMSFVDLTDSIDKADSNERKKIRAAMIEWREKMTTSGGKKFFDELIAYVDEFARKRD